MTNTITLYLKHYILLGFLSLIIYPNFAQCADPDISSITIYDDINVGSKNLETLYNSAVTSKTFNNNNKINEVRWEFVSSPQSSGPQDRNVLVKPNNDVDFPNTGRGPEEIYVFKRIEIDEATGCTLSITTVNFEYVGGNGRGGKNIDEKACIVIGTGETVTKEQLFASLSKENLRFCSINDCGNDWYEVRTQTKDENGPNGFEFEFDESSSITFPVGIGDGENDRTLFFNGGSQNSAAVTINYTDVCDAEDLKFTFANSKKENGFYEVDVMIQTINSGSFKLGSGQLFIKYNTEAFGENIASGSNFEIITTDGIINDENNSNEQLYGNFTTGNTLSNVAFWKFEQLQNASTYTGSNVNNIAQKLCRLKLQYTDITKAPMVEFIWDYPLDNQFKTACSDVLGLCDDGFLIINDQFDSSGSELTLSNPDLALISALTLYPNPAQDMLYIKGDTSKLKLIEIYTLTGQKLTAINKNFNNINISKLNTGIYFFRIDTALASKTFKVVKK